MDPQVEAYLAGVSSAVRRRDAQTLIELMSRVTGQEPAAWPGRIIGFGSYHYRYESGREGDAPAAAFAPRSTATVVYLLDGLGRYTAELEALGPHTGGVGCLYLKRLDAVDLDVLERIVRSSYEAVTTGTFWQRARDGVPDAT